MIAAAGYFGLGDGERVRAATEFAAKGWAVLGPPVLAPLVFGALLGEAAEQRRRGGWPLRTGDGRSRVPEATHRAQLGPHARALMAAAETLVLLQAMIGRPVKPGWSASCFTYYDEPGSWLGRHCDKPGACDIAFLVGLESRWTGAAPSPGNQLWIYPDDAATVPVMRITTRANRVVVLDGARLPHLRPPLEAGATVTVLSACYGRAP